MKNIMFITAFAFLAGCADGGIGRQGSPAWKATADPSAQRQYYQGVCLDKGYKLGSKEMQACISGKPTSPDFKPLDIQNPYKRSQSNRIRDLEDELEEVENRARRACQEIGGYYYPNIGCR